MSDKLFSNSTTGGYAFGDSPYTGGYETYEGGNFRYELYSGAALFAILDAAMIVTLLLVVWYMGSGVSLLDLPASLTYIGGTVLVMYAASEWAGKDAANNFIRGYMPAAVSNVLL